MENQTAHKKKYNPLELNQTERVISASGGATSQQQRSTRPTHMTIFLAKKLSKMLVHKKEKVIEKALHNLYGRHNPINYRPEFKFQESWENSKKQTIFQQKYSLLKTDNYFYISLHIVLFVLYGFTAWFYSVYRIFMLDSNFFVYVALVMLAKVSDVIVKQVLLSQTFAENNDAKRELSIKDYFKFHWLSILSFLYLTMICLQEYSLGITKNEYLIFVDLFFAWSSYLRFTEIYSAIKFKSLSSDFRNEIQILQLFGSCILLVHIFGLILYLVSKTNAEVNWTNSISNFNDNWSLRYVYSVYFACTTALTVGYGDITPQNEFQLITIMCVQILGIINIGYIVNQIGRVLAKINEIQEILSNNISQTEKVIKKYSLPEHLATKMRSNFINNRPATGQLHIEEQDNLLSKFKEELREKIKTYNHRKAVKYSVFFLCNWTTKFQNNIAQKLIRCIYSPQETITQTFGKQKIFLITKGRLQIEACSSNLSNIKKTINVVQYNPSKEVQFNVYGYSSCISGLKINIKAIAKDYSICYHVSKEDILKIIAESDTDFEYYHQIKDRIEQSRIKQLWEAPNIANTREHYLPNCSYVIKKDKLAVKKVNNRKIYFRSEFKHKCYVQQNMQASQKEINSEKEETSFNPSLQESSIMQTIQPLRNTVLTEKERLQKYSSIIKYEKAQFMVTNRKYRNRNPKLRQMDTAQLQKLEVERMFNQFESSQHYKLYFPKFNQSNMVRKYNKKFCLRPDSFISRSDTKLVQLLNDDLIQKLMSAKAYNSLII